MILAASGGYATCAAALLLPHVTSLSRITRSKGISTRIDSHSSSTACASQNAILLSLLLLSAAAGAFATKPRTCNCQRAQQHSTHQADGQRPLPDSWLMVLLLLACISMSNCSRPCATSHVRGYSGKPPYDGLKTSPTQQYASIVLHMTAKSAFTILWHACLLT